MPQVARRTFLAAALGGPFITGQIDPTEKPTELPDFDGTKIQRVADPANMTALEREHLVEISLPEEVEAGKPFKATISMPNHPNTPAHHIMWMRFFVDVQMLSYITFAPKWQLPEVTLTLQPTIGTRVEAIVNCNVHGIWGAKAPLNIKY